MQVDDMLGFRWLGRLLGRGGVRRVGRRRPGVPFTTQQPRQGGRPHSHLAALEKVPTRCELGMLEKGIHLLGLLRTRGFSTGSLSRCVYLFNTASMFNITLATTVMAASCAGAILSGSVPNGSVAILVAASTSLI